jgi:hypothetical protein
MASPAKTKMRAPTRGPLRPAGEVAVHANARARSAPGFSAIEAGDAQI